MIEADGAPSTFLGKQPEQVFSQEALGPKATLEVRAPCAAQRRGPAAAARGGF